MKKLFKWLAIGFITIICAAYLVIAGFLWWGEKISLPPESKDGLAFSATSAAPHQMTLINDGLTSLAKRIELIESAKQTLELEFFIYELDLASQLVTQKLIEAAKRGVSVKLLVDFSAPVFQFKPTYAKVLSENKIEVRYYNTVQTFRFVSVQHRSHRKLLIADGRSVITGGRNIGDDYFNLSHHFNFLDSDVLITGPIVQNIRDSFLSYWNSDFATQANQFKIFDSGFENDFFRQSSKAENALSEIKSLFIAENKNLKTHECTDTTFVTDHPGVSPANRQVFKKISELLGEAKEELFVESPYFVLRPDGMSLLSALNQRGVKQTVITNSLASTDAFYTVSALSFTLPELDWNQIKVFVYNGQPSPLSRSLSSGTSERWGVHAKRAVIDRKHILIGTYNVDPRSANFNSEILVVCKNNPELAQDVINSMEDHKSRSTSLFDSNENAYRVLLKDSTIQQKIMFVLALPLSKLFDFLL